MSEKKVAVNRLQFILREALILAIMAVVVFYIYSNTLRSPFVLDDLNSIKFNTHIRITGFDLEDIIQAGSDSPLTNRPVAYVSFALNYYFHQLNVAGFHIANILIHIVCGILLFYFTKTTLHTPVLQNSSEKYAWVPLLTALIWLVHPIQTQSVTYVVQRMNSLASMFYVLSILLYARGRQSEKDFPRYACFTGCVLSGLLALGSKEVAVTLPVFLFLYEWYFYQDLNREWLKRRVLPIFGIMAVLLLVALFYLDFQPLEKILNSYAGRNFTMPQRVLTEFRIVVFYLSLILFPHPSRLNLEHHFPVSQSLVEPITTVLAIGIITGLLVMAFFIAKRQRLLSFCILWYLGNLVLESSIIGLELVFEHRNYLPSMLIILMLMMLLHRYGRIRWVTIGFPVVIALVCCVYTVNRNNIWRNELSLWQDCAAKSPQKARPHNNLAVALVRQGKIKEAISNYHRALQIKPDYAEAHFNLATALRRQGKLNQAVHHYREMIRIKPDYSGAHNNLGAVLQEQGRIDEAISHYSEALRLRPDYPGVHFNMGVALNKQGRTPEAIAHLSESLRQDPDHTGAHYHLALAYKKNGDLTAAVSHLKTALHLKPDHAEALIALGAIRHQQGETDAAKAHYSTALEIKPGFPNAHNDLGVILYQEGRLQAAAAHFRAALKFKADYAEAHNNLGTALDDLGQRERAQHHYREALRIEPDHVGAHNNLAITLAMEGNLNEAVRHFGEALRINPEDALTLSNQANALASLGRYQEATRHYRAALKINPDDAEVKRNLERAMRKLGK
jgi:tetratricopeptide (TPR) repeat protein